MPVLLHGSVVGKVDEVCAAAEGQAAKSNVGSQASRHVVGMITRTDVLRARFGARYIADGATARAPSFAARMAEVLPAPAQRLLQTVGEEAAACGARAYVVGGFVRDVLLGMRSLDLDILVEPDAAVLARAVAAATGGDVRLEERFDAAKVTLPSGLRLDFTSARTESYAEPGALPRGRGLLRPG